MVKKGELISTFLRGFKRFLVSGSTLTFTPDESLRSGGSYEMLILEVDDLEGNTLEEAFSLVFHTER